jgi:hypothetical protein
MLSMKLFDYGCLLGIARRHVFGQARLVHTYANTLLRNKNRLRISVRKYTKIKSYLNRPLEGSQRVSFLRNNPRNSRRGYTLR